LTTFTEGEGEKGEGELEGGCIFMREERKGDRPFFGREEKKEKRKKVLRERTPV